MWVDVIKYHVGHGICIQNYSDYQNIDIKTVLITNISLSGGHGPKKTDLSNVSKMLILSTGYVTSISIFTIKHFSPKNDFGINRICI